VEAPCRTRRIVAAITNKDFVRHSPSQGFYTNILNQCGLFRPDFSSTGKV
jgi:hypothetical protein